MFTLHLIYIYHSSFLPFPGKIPADAPVDVQLVNKFIGIENIFKKICYFRLC